MTSALEGGEKSASRPGRTLPPGKTRYPLCRRLDGPQCRSGQVRKISPPPGFDPRTVQPVGSRYTDCATRPISLSSFLILYSYLRFGYSDGSLRSSRPTNAIMLNDFHPLSRPPRLPPSHATLLDAVDPSGRAVKGVGLRPLACRDCGFESHRGHPCLF